jgi:hypothetical protein
VSLFHLPTNEVSDSKTTQIHFLSVFDIQFFLVVCSVLRFSGHLELGKWTYLIFAIDLVVLITIVVIVVIVGRKALKRAEEEAQLHEALIKHANEEKIHPNDPQKSLIYWDIIENHRSLTFQKNDSSVASVPNINDDDKIYIDTERLLTISRFPPLDQNSVSDLLETADNNDKHFDVI